MAAKKRKVGHVILEIVGLPSSGNLDAGVIAYHTRKGTNEHPLLVDQEVDQPYGGQLNSPPVRCFCKTYVAQITRFLLS
jgi:hypothetical protein